MTQQSQFRIHLGKRGAAQRKARREGYALAHVHSPYVRDADRLIQFSFDYSRMMFSESPYLLAAFRQGAHDWVRKHEGKERVVF